MKKFKKYLFTYTYKGENWTFHIIAEDHLDATARLNRMLFARYDGESLGSVPSWLGGRWLVPLVCWWHNLGRRG